MVASAAFQHDGRSRDSREKSQKWLKRVPAEGTMGPCACACQTRRAAFKKQGARTWTLAGRDLRELIGKETRADSTSHYVIIQSEETLLCSFGALNCTKRRCEPQWLQGAAGESTRGRGLLGLRLDWMLFYLTFYFYFKGFAYWLCVNSRSSLPKKKVPKSSIQRFILNMSLNFFIHCFLPMEV